MSEQKKEQTCWFVRLGEIGQHDDDAISKNVITIDFGIREKPEIFKDKNHITIREMVKNKFPNLTNQMLAKIASPINMFVNSMKIGDIVVCPFKTFGGQIYIGEIVGECEQNEQGLLTHKVKWINQKPLSRDIFPMDLLNTFTTWLTVFKIDRDGASERFQNIASNPDNANVDDNYFKFYEMTKGLTPQESTDEVSTIKESVSEDDLEAKAINEINSRFRDRFASSGLEEVINAILVAKGYETLYSPSDSQDDIVDIITGCGEWGFDSPRILARVRSGIGGESKEKDVFNDFEALVNEYKADYGLFVSWQDFSPEVYQQAKNQFFKIRLWNKEKIIDEFSKIYDKLPDDIKAKLPLKRIWMVDQDLDSDS